MKWLRYCFVQFGSLLASIVGLLLLVPFSLAKAWVADAKSIKDGRQIDRWKLKWLDYVYGNPEDGVSGQYAVLVSGLPFLPTAGPRWRAYRWSALRNSADALKYRLADPNGPLIDKWVHVKIGYQQENGFNVPVFSVKSE